MRLLRPARASGLGLVLVAGCFLPLLTSSDAKAAYDPVAGGSITWTLAKPFARLLAAHHVQIGVKGGGRRRGEKIVLTAGSGSFDPALGAGTVQASGTLVFVAGKRTLPFREVTFESKSAPLTAKVGGGRLKIATGARVQGRRDGFGVTFSAGALRLSAKAASRLNKKLRLGRSLRAGEPIGTIKATARPETVHLREEGRMQLALDPAFMAELDELFVSLNPIAPAELTQGPVLSFPIGPESTLAPNASLGTLKLAGQAELLQLGSAQMFWREVWLQPTAALLAETETLPSPPHPGKAPQSPLLSLQAPASLTSDPASRRITVAGQVVSLPSTTAAALNDAFASSQGKGDVFSPGEPVGSLSFVATGE